MIGVALHLACCLAAAIAVAVGARLPEPRIQGRIRGFLALGSLYLAVAVAYAGRNATIRSTWQCALLVLGALLLGNCIGMLLGVQRASNRAARWGAVALEPGVVPARFGAGLAVVLGLNPLGWLAGLLAGLTGDWRPLVLKGVLDALGIWATARTRPAAAALAAVGVAAGQGALCLAGEACRNGFEAADLIGVFGISAGVYLAILPLVLFGVARVPLANLFLSLPAVVVLARLWR